MTSTISRASWAMLAGAILLPLSLFSQVSNPRRNEVTQDVRVEAKLTGVIPNYEDGDRDIYSAQLRLDLQYTNVGRLPVILYRFPSIFHVEVARDVKSLQEGRLEYSIQLDDSTIDPLTERTLFDALIAESPGTKDTVILGPGQKCTLHDSVPVFVRRNSGHHPNSIDPGSHVVRIFIANWPFTYILDTDELPPDWKSAGAVFTGSLKSNPVAFQIVERER